MSLQITGGSSAGGSGAATDGSNITSPATWRSNLAVPTITVSGTRSRPESSGVAFDGVTTNNRILSTLTGSNIGTGDYSIAVSFRMPQSLGGGQRNIIALTPTSTDVRVANAVSLFIYTDGSIVVQQNGSPSTDYKQLLTASGIQAAYAGQTVHVVFTRTGSTATLYLNGETISTTTATGGSGVWTSSVTASYLYLGGGTTGGVYLFNSTIYSAHVFNRALSATEVSDLAQTGTAPDDLAANFTSQTSGVLVAGKRYRIVTFVAGDSFTNVGAASNATGVEFIASGTTPTTWTNASTLQRIGCVCEPDLSVGIGSFFPDLSGNGFFGDSTSTGIFHTRPRRTGAFTISVPFAHSDISSTASTTRFFDLPPNCAVIRAELDRTVAFDATITLNIGVAASANRFVSASVLSATGLLTAASSATTSQSNSASTTVYVQKSGATTVGNVVVAVFCEIHR